MPTGPKEPAAPAIAATVGSMLGLASIAPPAIPLYAGRAVEGDGMPDAEHDPQFQVTWLVEDEVLEGTPARGFRSVRLIGYDAPVVTRLAPKVKAATRRRSVQAWLVLKEGIN